AVLSWFGSTITLPGIAGIVLTVGMAVDANVLIFERIKEELGKQKSLVHGVQQGFDRAWSAILDSNITTLIIALLLYLFASGPVKGFAITITVGLLISLYTAVALTKLVIQIWCNRRYRLDMAKAKS
ncbi:MAG: MMPL family transporter, partial [Pseudomonadota bacterium]